MPSTAIGRVDYDPETRQLFIEFVSNGRRYVYEQVPPETYHAFRNAFAKGSFFNEAIRPNYDCELLFDPQWGHPRRAV